MKRYKKRYYYPLSLLPRYWHSADSSFSPKSLTRREAEQLSKRQEVIA